MTSRRATPSADGARGAECACGLAFADPWDLIGHFLAVYPPDADKPLDDTSHADVTSLAVKLSEGPTQAWEIGAWARDPKKHRRLAAAIARQAATGELEPWDEVRYRDVRETYRVSSYAVASALSELRARAIIGNYGGTNNVHPPDLIPDDPVTRILNLLATHMTNLEAEVSALKARAGCSGLASWGPVNEHPRPGRLAPDVATCHVLPDLANHGDVDHVCRPSP